MINHIHHNLLERGFLLRVVLFLEFECDDLRDGRRQGDPGGIAKGNVAHHEVPTYDCAELLEDLWIELLVVLKGFVVLISVPDCVR